MIIIIIILYCIVIIIIKNKSKVRSFDKSIVHEGLKQTQTKYTQINKHMYTYKLISDLLTNTY